MSSPFHWQQVRKERSIGSAASASDASDTARAHVAIVYQFFPHYRAGILEELLIRGQFRYELYGARTDPVASNIPSWSVPADCTFVETPHVRLPWKLLFQRKVIQLALRRDLQAVVFLGDPHYLATWFAAALCRITGKRVLFWTHGWTHDDSWYRGVLRTAFYRLAHGLLLYGHFAKDRGLALGFKPENMYVIYNSLDDVTLTNARSGVSKDQIASARASWFVQPELPTVVFVGRLINKNRLDLLLAAAKILRAARYPINVLIVGDGPLRNNLEYEAQESELSARFLGAVYDEQVLVAAFRCAQLTVIPGAAGLTVIHSLCYGTPVLTHDDPMHQFPEFEAVIPGVSGRHFEYGSASSLADAIRQSTESALALRRTASDVELPIRRLYNPRNQRQIIERAIAGYPADDLAVGIDSVPK